MSHYFSLKIRPETKLCVTILKHNINKAIKSIYKKHLNIIIWLNMDGFFSNSEFIGVKYILRSGHMEDNTI